MRKSKTEEKKLNESETIKVENNLFQIQEVKKEEIIRPKTDKQSDKIMQNILNASKLLEGRISFEQLINLDIPTFDRIVNNEFANIDRSYKEFREHGTINAYTKNETTNMDNAALKELSH